MSFSRAKIEAYADKFWPMPCDDNLVYTKSRQVNVKLEIAKRKLDPTKWHGIFLREKDLDDWTKEGLYIARGLDLDKIRANGIDDLKVADDDKIMLAAYHDDNKKNHLKKMPPYFGLNDCAHFVTECLAAGGVNFHTGNVPVLLTYLRARRDTKTLAYMVPYEKAWPIVTAGIMKAGDVFIYSSGKTKEHHHSSVYVGDMRRAMHTWCNHPNDKRLQGEWAGYRDEDHDRFTLIHFDWDDRIGVAESLIAGPWKWNRPSGEEFLFLHQDGWCLRSSSKVGANSAGGVGVERGYWFYRDRSLVICFTKTGTSATFKNFPVLNPGTKVVGKIDGLENVTISNTD